MSSIESLTLLVAQLQQTVFGQTERMHALEERVRLLEQERARTPTPAMSQPTSAKAAPPAAGSIDEHRAQERAEILAALKSTNWNRLEAARILALPRRTLYRRMAEYGIQEGDSRTGIAKREKERAVTKRAVTKRAPATKKKPSG